MSSITVYSFENANGPFGSYTTQNINDAREYGRNNALKVIANEYEFSDSELVEDFTNDREARLRAALGRHDWTIAHIAHACDFRVEDMHHNPWVLVERSPADGDLWVTVHKNPRAVEDYIERDDDDSYTPAFVVDVQTGDAYEIETTVKLKPSEEGL